MKLLLCTSCSDVRSLRIERWTRCRCGRSRARYLDNVLAQVIGDCALLLGLRNDEMLDALRRESADRKAGVTRDLGHEFTGFVIPAGSSHVIEHKRSRRGGQPRSAT